MRPIITGLAALTALAAAALMLNTATAHECPEDSPACHIEGPNSGGTLFDEPQPVGGQVNFTFSTSALDWEYAPPEADAGPHAKVDNAQGAPLAAFCTASSGHATSIFSDTELRDDFGLTLDEAQGRLHGTLKAPPRLEHGGYRWTPVEGTNDAGDPTYT